MLKEIHVLMKLVGIFSGKLDVAKLDDMIQTYVEELTDWFTTIPKQNHKEIVT